MATATTYDLKDALVHADGVEVVTRHTQEVPGSFFERNAALREAQSGSDEIEHLASIPVGVAQLWKQMHGFDMHEAMREEL